MLDPTQTVADSAPPPKPPKDKGKFWTRTKVILSGTLAFVGAVTGVISIVPILTRDATNFSHLEIAAEPVASDTTEWAIPIEALDAEFPLGGVGCGPEQLEWLGTHAEPIQRSFMLNLRNSAREGAMLALTEFRSTTQGDEDRGAIRVRLVCAPSGVLPQSAYYAKLPADDPSAEAVHVRVEAGAAPNSSPEIPVAFNLAPGESGKVPIDLFSRNPVVGAMQVTVLSRDEARTVEIAGSEFEMPALLFGGEMFLFTTNEGLVCNRVESGTLLPCTVDELGHEWQAAAR
ncbi:MAG: hypothetical protein GX862_00360 [Leucobacter sp.]|nr:hypothetical protein [Leucobacter sp.]